MARVVTPCLLQHVGELAEMTLFTTIVSTNSFKIPFLKHVLNAAFDNSGIRIPQITHYPRSRESNSNGRTIVICTPVNAL